MSKSFFDQYAYGKIADKIHRIEARLFEILFAPDVDFQHLSEYDKSVALERAMTQIELEEARMDMDRAATYFSGVVSTAYLIGHAWTALSRSVRTLADHRVFKDIHWKYTVWRWGRVARALDNEHEKRMLGSRRALNERIERAEVELAQLKEIREKLP